VLRVVFLVSAAVLITFLSTRGWFQPVESAVGLVTMPLQRILDASGRAVSSVAGSFTETRDLRAENAALKKTVDELVREVVMLRGAELENRTLREQLGYVQSATEWRYLPAQVIGRDPTKVLEYIIIDRGSESGVREGMVVVTPRGLVGRVTRVTPHWAKVLLITSPSSAVNAVVQGGSQRAFGIIYGAADGRLQMRYILQTEEVRLRDLVVTSGMGGGLPRNLTIGQVINVQRADFQMFQTAEIEPFVDFAHLEHVLVIANFLPQPLEERDNRAP